MTWTARTHHCDLSAVNRKSWMRQVMINRNMPSGRPSANTCLFWVKFEWQLGLLHLLHEGDCVHRASILDTPKEKREKGSSERLHLLNHAVSHVSTNTPLWLHIRCSATLKGDTCWVLSSINKNQQSLKFYKLMFYGTLESNFLKLLYCSYS